MSKEYDLYLQNHRAGVKRAYEWIKENLPSLIPDYLGMSMEHQICFAHDASKNELDEYRPYDAYFYGNNRSYDVVDEYKKAWLLHIHRNPHHWQYWVLNCDDPELGEIILDMPYNYILEMICDWWSFSIANGMPYEIFDWYDQRCEYMKFSDKTRITVIDILNAIKVKLDRELTTKYVNVNGQVTTY